MQILNINRVIELLTKRHKLQMAKYSLDECETVKVDEAHVSIDTLRAAVADAITIDLGKIESELKALGVQLNTACTL